MTGPDIPSDDSGDAILKDLPPDAATLQKKEYAIVTFPSEYGHSDKGRLLACGARYMGNAFRKLLSRVDVQFQTETIRCAHRSAKIIEATRAILGKWSTRPGKDTDALRHFDEVRADTKVDYDACLRHFIAGRRLLHAAASHDA